ncbi:MAG: OmpA family protein [Acidimicrobiia bacterium]
MSRRAAFLLALLLCLLLIGSACQNRVRQTSSQATPSASPSPEVSATASPAASPTATPEDDVSAEARAIIIELGGRNGPEGLLLDLSADILFESGSAELSAEAQPTIDKVARLARLIRRDRIRITGHTDNVGSEEGNRRLSVARAESVRNALVAAYADIGGRAVVRGLGETAPIADNSTAEGRAKNRRVEIEFQGIRFRP